MFYLVVSIVCVTVSVHAAAHVQPLQDPNGRDGGSALPPTPQTTPSGSVASPPTSARPGPFSGIVVDPDSAGGHPTLYEYRYHPDSGLSVRSLGHLDVQPGLLSGIPELPTTGGPTLRIPTDTYIGIADRVRDMVGDGPQNMWGVSVDEGRVRFSLSRGVSVVAAIASGLGLLAAVSFGFVLARLRRERARRIALITAAQRQSEAREAERVRIAREIHDGPIQDLHAVRAQISVHAELQSRPAGRSPAPYLDVSEAVSGVARELRAIAEDLRPPALSRFGLSAALSAHATRFTERNPGVRVRLRLDDDDAPGVPPLSEPARAALFRVVQEAMTNAVRHGRARNVEVELQFAPSPELPKEVRIEVRDDGRGLPPGVTDDLDHLTEGGHFGLAGIHERAALLGGRFSLLPRRGEDIEGNQSDSTGLVARFVAPWSAVAASLARPIV